MVETSEHWCLQSQFCVLYAEVMQPIHFAKILTYPEQVYIVVIIITVFIICTIVQVNSSNLQFMNQVVLNGPNKHAGANFVEIYEN